MASERNVDQHDIDVIVQEMHDSGVDWRKVQGLIDLCRAAVAELLSLRSLRDAGDEEVELIADELTAIISEMEDGTAINVLVHANGLARKLRDIAITRGQQLREAREEIERLKGDAERYRWLRSHSWHEPYHIFFGPGCNQLESHHLDQAIDNEMNTRSSKESRHEP